MGNGKRRANSNDIRASFAARIGRYVEAEAEMLEKRATGLYDAKGTGKGGLETWLDVVMLARSADYSQIKKLPKNVSLEKLDENAKNRIVLRRFAEIAGYPGAFENNHLGVKPGDKKLEFFDVRKLPTKPETWDELEKRAGKKQKVMLGADALATLAFIRFADTVFGTGADPRDKTDYYVLSRTVGETIVITAITASGRMPSLGLSLDDKKSFAAGRFFDINIVTLLKGFDSDSIEMLFGDLVEKAERETILNNVKLFIRQMSNEGTELVPKDQLGRKLVMQSSLCGDSSYSFCRTNSYSANQQKRARGFRCPNAGIRRLDVSRNACEELYSLMEMCCRDRKLGRGIDMSREYLQKLARLVADNLSDDKNPRIEEVSRILVNLADYTGEGKENAFGELFDEWCGLSIRKADIAQKKRLIRLKKSLGDRFDLTKIQKKERVRTEEDFKTALEKLSTGIEKLNDIDETAHFTHESFRECGKYRYTARERMLFEEIRDNLSGGRDVFAVVYVPTQDAEKSSEKRLFEGHAYSVYRCVPSEDNRRGGLSIVLRNPCHGKGTGFDGNGFFEIEFNEFVQNFSCVYVSGAKRSDALKRLETYRLPAKTRAMAARTIADNGGRIPIELKRMLDSKAGPRH